MNNIISRLTFVVSRSGNPAIFDHNFSVSPALAHVPSDQIIVQEGFPSASLAYNDAIEKARTDIIVFAHQDVYFPEQWLADLNRAIRHLEKSDPDWGMLGCWGVNNRGLEAGYLYSVGLGVLGVPFDSPVKIDTLDEYVLILRKSSGLRFNEALPRFHFYGTDICMTARKNNMNCYAISAYTVHNTSYGLLSQEFYECYWHIKRLWREFLPIQTPCIRVTQWNEDYYIRRLKAAYFNLIGRDLTIPRVSDPAVVLRSHPDQTIRQSGGSVTPTESIHDTPVSIGTK
jgi:hypothetical protein